MKYLFLLILPLPLLANPTFEQSRRILVGEMRDQKVPEKKIRCYEDAQSDDDIKECRKKEKKEKKVEEKTIP